jgi:hypothetical protein
VEAAIPPVIPAAREAGLRRLRCKASWRKVWETLSQKQAGCNMHVYNPNYTETEVGGSKSEAGAKQKYKTLPEK